MSEQAGDQARSADSEESEESDLRRTLLGIAERFATGAATPAEHAGLADLASQLARQAPPTLAELRPLLARLSHDGYLRGTLVVLATHLATHLARTVNDASAVIREPGAIGQSDPGAQADSDASLGHLRLASHLAHELLDALAPELGIELAQNLLATQAVECQRFHVASIYVDLHRLLARTHAELGQWHAALRHYEAIVACDIDDAQALAGWAQCLERLPARKVPGSASGPELVEGLDELQADQFLDHPRYELGRPLGRGRHAVVHAAHDRRVGRDVAIKRLLDRSGVNAGVGPKGLSPADARQFFAEARALASIRSPHVVSILDVQIERGFIVLDLCRGGSLRMALRRRAIDRSRLGSIARQLELGLAAIHAAGAIHRDVKPANILFRTRDDDSAIALADFGLALHIETDDQPSTQGPARRAGTLRYLAPEVRSGAPATAAADIYSAGVVLLEIAMAPDALPSGLAEALDSLQGIGDPAPWIPESLPLATRTLITGLLDPRPDQRRWAPGAPAW